MSTDQQSQLDAILRQGRLDTAGDVQTLRAAFNELMARVQVAPDVQQRPVELGGVNGVEVAIQGDEAESVILYFHGGVYVIGTASASVPLVSDLVRRTGARAITLEYRLGPEHPYPAAVEDARAAYEGLLAQGIAPAQIVLAGESAGGGLAVATLLALRQAGVPLPSCGYLMSPYVHLTLSGESLAEKAEVDPVLTPRGTPCSGSGLRSPGRAVRPFDQPYLRRSHGVATASHPGRLPRDPPERRTSTCRTGCPVRCHGHARSHPRRPTRLPGIRGPARRGWSRTRPGSSLHEGSARPLALRPWRSAHNARP